MLQPCSPTTTGADSRSDSAVGVTPRDRAMTLKLQPAGASEVQRLGSSPAAASTTETNMRLTFARAALIAAYFGIAVPFLATADGIDVLRDAETGPEALPAA